MNKWQDITDMEVSRGECCIANRTPIVISTADSLDLLSQYCSEFLVHAADVEGLCQGIDEDLVTSTSIRLFYDTGSSFLNPRLELGEWVKVPTTYAGGAKGRLLLVLQGSVARLTDPLSVDISDLDLVDRLSGGRVDLTYGR